MEEKEEKKKKKMEKLEKENEENNLKENGINPPKNDNWGSVNDLGF